MEFRSTHFFRKNLIFQQCFILRYLIKKQDCKLFYYEAEQIRGYFIAPADNRTISVPSDLRYNTSQGTDGL